MNLITMLDEYFGGFQPPLGAAHAVSSDAPEEDVVMKLRRAIEDATGQTLEQRPRPRMGFLP